MAVLVRQAIPEGLSGDSAGEVRNKRAFAVLRSDGSVVCWGDPAQGGDRSSVAALLNSGVEQIFSSSQAFAALRNDGGVVTWGNGASGGDSSAVAAQLRSGVVQIFSTQHAFAALKADGSVVTWGAAASGGDSSAVAAQLAGGVSRIFATRDGAFAALKQDGSVVTWGAAAAGGDSRNVRGRLAGNVSQIYASQRAFAALKSDGSVVCWGDPDYGGDNSAVAASLAPGAIKIVANAYAFAALKSDSSVVYWGYPAFGFRLDLPAEKARDIYQIAATDSAFAARRADGSVVAWGYWMLFNKYGIQRGITADVAPGLSSSVEWVFANSEAFVALKRDGSLVSWETANTNGGNSSAVIGAISVDVRTVFANAQAFAALKRDGSVVSWGNPASGGDSSAVAASLRSGVTQIFSTEAAFAALRGDGSVATWGDGGAGGDSRALAAQLQNVVSFADPLSDDRLVPDPHAFTPGPLTIAGITLGRTPLGYALRNVAGEAIQITWNFGQYTTASNPGSDWLPIAAAVQDSVYTVYWRQTFTNLYARWRLNSSGQFVLGTVLNNEQLGEAETSLHTDLNGDGIVGFVPFTPGPNRVGDITLGRTDQGLALRKGSDPPLAIRTTAGSIVTPGQPGGGWAALAACATRAGYGLYWRNPFSNQVARWELDADGQATATAVLSEVEMLEAEQTLNVDMNQDAIVGFGSWQAGPATLGGWSLASSPLGYGLKVGDASPIPLSWDGGRMASASSPGADWYATAVVPLQESQEVFWLNSQTHDFARWQVNGAGQRLDGSFLSALALFETESSLGVDLNRDTVIGMPFTPGSYPLEGVVVGTNAIGYAIRTASGEMVQIRGDGGEPASPFNPGRYWEAVAAIATPTGFDLYWQNTSMGLNVPRDPYARWSLDPSGARSGGSVLSAAEFAQEAARIGLDLSRDPLTGQIYTPGAVTLQGVNLGSTALGYAIQVGDTSPRPIRDLKGEFASAFQPGEGWTAIAAAPKPLGYGYNLYWRNIFSGEVGRWQLAPSGASYFGQVLSNENVVAAETLLNFDLSGNGSIGVV